MAGAIPVRHSHCCVVDGVCWVQSAVTMSYSETAGFEVITLSFIHGLGQHLPDQAGGWAASPAGP